MIVEALDAPTLGEATKSRLIVEGASQTVNILASVVLELLGGDVTRAVTVLDGVEIEVTRDYVPRIDILDAGDISE